MARAMQMTMPVSRQPVQAENDDLQRSMRAMGQGLPPGIGPVARGGDAARRSNPLTGQGGLPPQQAPGDLGGGYQPPYWPGMGKPGWTPPSVNNPIGQSPFDWGSPNRGGQQGNPFMGPQQPGGSAGLQGILQKQLQGAVNKGGQQLGGPGGRPGGQAGMFGQSPGGGHSMMPYPNPGDAWQPGYQNPFIPPQQGGGNSTGMTGDPSAAPGGLGIRYMGPPTAGGSWSNPFSGMNFNIPTPSAGTIGGFLGGAVGGLPGAFLGNRAGSWLADRFGWGQGGASLTDSPSPFMPGWLGGSGESSLDGPEQFNMTAPGNLRQLGPDGQRATGMGTYRGSGGFATGYINPEDLMGGMDPMSGMSTQQMLGPAGNRLSRLRR